MLAAKEPQEDNHAAPVAELAALAGPCVSVFVKMLMGYIDRY